MRKAAVISLSAMMAVVSCMGAMAQETEPDMTEGTVTPVVEEIPEDAVEIASAEDLGEVMNNLSAYYVLTADIDLEGAAITPIGSFVPVGEEGEEAVEEAPAPKKPAKPAKAAKGKKGKKGKKR